ncbi:hypothetical protein A9Q84_16070 [Halobacteriovorax marinus]|uniref:CBS domain-containing protein n=1 Tax=Halobacteriovorax marinus TaxID=97084 RepID=A0A1Y5FAL9_9BACT|nr:hypothetical protein A9Q84_16070 [Halobacteriovorax marinus]
MVNYTPEFVKVTSDIDKSSNLEISEIMLGNFICIQEDTSISEATKILLKNNFTGAPVVDKENKLIGFLSERECLKYNFDMQYYNECPLTVNHHMSTGIITLDPHDKFFHVVELFFKHHYHMYPVLEDQRVIGIVTRQLILKKLFELNQTTW